MKRLYLILFLIINYFNISAQCTIERINNPNLFKSSGGFTGWTLSNSDVTTSSSNQGLVFIRDGQINNLTQNITTVNPQGNISPVFNISVGTYDALRPSDSAPMTLDMYYAGVLYMRIQTLYGVTSGGAYVYYYSGATGNLTRVPMNPTGTIANVTATIALKLPSNVPNSGELRFNYNASGNKPVDDIYIGKVSLITTVNVSTPVISTNGATTFCEGGSVTLTSSNTSGNQWYLNGTTIPGATGQTYVVTTSGTYTVKSTLNNCTSPSAAGVNVVVNSVPPQLNVTASGSTTFCNGGSVQLVSDYNTSGSYQWFRNGVLIPGAIYYNYTATIAGTYTVTRTLNNCSSPSSAGINVVVEPNLTTPIIMGNKTSICAGENIILSTSVIATSYQWYRDNILIPGANAQIYTATQAGNYTVKIISGTCSAISVNYKIDDSTNCYCIKPGNFSTTSGLISKIGITGQTKLTNWPEKVPNGFIALESKAKGFVITRIQNAGMIPKSELREGMLIYDIESKCVKLYNGTVWNCIQRSCNE